MSAHQSRKFRFGFVADRAESASSWRTLAKRVEATGFSTLLVSDHFFNGIAPLTALAMAAEATSSLRVGTLVLSNDFRHPAVLAKEAATLDLLSDGRLELGLGAGWLRSEYDQVGLSYLPPADRIDRLRESIVVLKALFGEGPCDFAGDHYRISDLEGRPKPVQHGGPPILVGGAGRRMLQMAGKLADIVGLAPRVTTGGVVDTSSFGIDAARQKLQWVREGAGDRFVDIELNIQLAGPVMLDSDREDGARRILEWRQRVRGTTGPTESEVLDSPSFLIGPADQLVEILQQRRDELGITYIVTGVGGDSDLSAVTPIVERLAGM